MEDRLMVATTTLPLPLPLPLLTKYGGPWLARAYLTAGEVEEAAVTVGRAVDLAHGVASERPLQRIAPLIDDLRHHGDVPAVRGLMAHLAA